MATCADLARTRKMRAFHVPSSLSPLLTPESLLPRPNSRLSFGYCGLSVLMETTGLGSGIREIYEISRMEESRRRSLHHGRRRSRSRRRSPSLRGSWTTWRFSLSFPLLIFRHSPLPRSLPSPPSPRHPIPPCLTTRQTHVTYNPTPPRSHPSQQTTIGGMAMVLSTQETPPSRLCLHCHRFRRIRSHNCRRL
jgi:hypothetical protein